MNGSSIPILRPKSSNIDWNGSIDARPYDITAENLFAESSVLGTVRYKSGTAITLYSTTGNSAGTVNTYKLVGIFRLPDTIQLGSTVKVTVNLASGSPGVACILYFYQTPMVGLSTEIGAQDSTTPASFTKNYVVISRSVYVYLYSGASPGTMDHLTITADADTPVSPSIIWSNEYD